MAHKLFQLPSLTRIVSYANYSILKETSQLILNPLKVPFSITFPTIIAKPYIIIRNINGDRGSPCLNHLDTIKSLLGLPVIKTNMLLLKTSPFIYLIH